MYHVPPDVIDRVNIKAIQTACQEAMHIVGIMPVRHAQKRERRLLGTTNTDIKTLLDTYFERTPLLKERKQILIDKTISLLDEINNNQDPD